MLSKVVLFLPHVFLQVGIKEVIRWVMHTPVNITGIKRETQNLGYIDISLPEMTGPEV